jgi:hypothetical protein
MSYSNKGRLNERTLKKAIREVIRYDSDGKKVVYNRFSYKFKLKKELIEKRIRKLKNQRKENAKKIKNIENLGSFGSLKYLVMNQENLQKEREKVSSGSLPNDEKAGEIKKIDLVINLTLKEKDNRVSKLKSILSGADDLGKKNDVVKEAENSREKVEALIKREFEGVPTGKFDNEGNQEHIGGVDRSLSYCKEFGPMTESVFSAEELGEVDIFRLSSYNNTFESVFDKQDAGYYDPYDDKEMIEDIPYSTVALEELNKFGYFDFSNITFEEEKKEEKKTQPKPKELAYKCEIGLKDNKKSVFGTELQSKSLY